MTRPRKNRDQNAFPPIRRAHIESLESRMLLSAAVGVARPDLVLLHPNQNGTEIGGYSPSQIRHAYGWDQLAFNNGAVAADGKGQTIAIVDAFANPNIQSDLSAFDAQWGLPDPPSFNVVNQRGASSPIPAADTGWGAEIDLDVQWSHAMAPGANILLVEADSPTFSDLNTAVDYARHVTGVSVVSMSWGGSEFFQFTEGNQVMSETAFDSFFTTPAGHPGETFVVSAGDSSQLSGTQYPASSPNVLSIGGTTLNVLDPSGTYGNEASWVGTNGGYSAFEPEPSYQRAAQNTGQRSVPDVTYNADPNTGFAFFDSLGDDLGNAGWQVVGGTSAGAPQWSALIAIANQGRVLAGKGTLDGVSQTMPILYGLYSPPATPGYSTYTNYFNDIVDSGSGVFTFPFGGMGFAGDPAAPGYDPASGLGSPQVGAVMGALTGIPSVVPAIPPTVSTTGPLSGTFLTAPPTSVVGGDKGVLKLRLTNTTASRFSGPVTITLYSSTTSSPSTPITSISLAHVNLRSGAGKTVTLRFNYPTNLTTGSYYVLASVNATATRSQPTLALNAAPVLIMAPVVDLAAGFANLTPVAVNSSGGGTAVVTVTNVGNVTASGAVSVNLYASTQPPTGNPPQPNGTLLTSVSGRPIRLRPGRSIRIAMHFTAPPGMAPGTFNLLANLIPNTQLADTDLTNNIALISTV